MVNYIAVDGPAGSGKSATFSRVAEKLGYKFIDTGLFYRAFCWSVLNLDEQVDLDDEQKLVSLLSDWRIEFKSDKVLVQWKKEEAAVEVSGELHSHQIDSNVSKIARHPAVREEIVELQRRQAHEQSPCVVLGRDIASVVLPDADLKFYLDTSVEERAKRRFAQLEKEGGDSSLTLQDVYNAIQKRDDVDKSRPVGPLVRAKDAIYVNNDSLSLDEAVELIVDIINRKS